jgi:hypothetical protein
VNALADALMHHHARGFPLLTRRAVFALDSVTVQWMLEDATHVRVRLQSLTSLQYV